jgi:hypothetical protein
MKSTSESRKDWVWITLLLGLVVAFYFRVLFENQIFVFVDASRFFYPLWKWGADALRQGWIPLWNPDAQFGTPYLADPQMAYAYPPVTLLYLFLNPTNAFAALVILHHFWALLGFWVFARAEGFSTRAALLGSLIFGFSLHLVCSSWTPVALLTISWIPWVFLAAGKCYRKERGGLLYLSFAWAMQLAAGYPVLTYLTVMAVGLHFGWKTFAGTNKSKGQLFSWLGVFFLGGTTAIVYNLVWGLPFLEMFQQSNYESGASRFHDLNWLDFGTILSPFDQGHPLLSGYHGPHYWVSTYFAGLPTLCLLAWGVIYMAYRKTSWGLLPVFLVLSLGVLGVGHAVMAVLPGYSLVIHSGFWLSLLVFWMAWLAMESLEDFLGPKLLPGQILLWTAIVVGIYGLSYFIQAPLSPAAFWISLVAAGLAVWLRDIRLRWILLLLSLGISLGTSAFSLNILLDRSYYEKPPQTMERIPKPGRLFFTPPLLGQAARLQGESMVAAYESAKENFYPNWPLAYGREEVPLYNTLQLRDSFAWTFQSFQHSLRHSRNVLDYLGIRYVFGKNQFKDFKNIESASPIEISENPSPGPKWFSVSLAKAAGPSLPKDFTQADKTLMDYSKECFIADSAKAGSYSPREVDWKQGAPTRLVLESKGSEKSLLVSSETDYPGWKVKVGDRQGMVEQINHSFRGVVLNPNETKALFYFDPATFRLGLFFALLVCGFWTMLFFKGF